jgi:hypothetical protein
MNDGAELSEAKIKWHEIKKKKKFLHLLFR